MENLNNTALGSALNDACIEFSITNTRQHEPHAEYFDDDFISKHGNEWATVDYFMATTPRFVNVRAKDYSRAINLVMEAQDEH